MKKVKINTQTHLRMWSQVVNLFHSTGDKLPVIDDNVSKWQFDISICFCSLLNC